MLYSHCVYRGTHNTKEEEKKTEWRANAKSNSSTNERNSQSHYMCNFAMHSSHTLLQIILFIRTKQYTYITQRTSHIARAKARTRTIRVYLYCSRSRAFASYYCCCRRRRTFFCCFYYSSFLSVYIALSVVALNGYRGNIRSVGFAVFL